MATAFPGDTEARLRDLVRGSGQLTAQREPSRRFSGANQLILAIFATSVGVAIVLLAAHSRPFSGEIAVSPAVLLQVMPEAAAPDNHSRQR